MLKITRLFALLLVVIFGSAPLYAADRTQSDINKEIVISFYNKALNEKDVEGAIALMGKTYTQHNPNIPDGKDGFRQYFNVFKSRFPNSHSEIVRAFAEGDFVILHVHMVTTPGELGRAIVDIFRLANGKLVEHWDVIQPIPEDMAHLNGMF